MRTGTTGVLAYTDEYLRYLSRTLPVPRQVELFLCIRRVCLLREAEFRPGFERAFPACVPFLPAPATRQQILSELGMTEEEYQRQIVRPSQVLPELGDPELDTGEEIPF